MVNILLDPENYNATNRKYTFIGVHTIQIIHYALLHSGSEKSAARGRSGLLCERKILRLRRDIYHHHHCIVDKSALLGFGPTDCLWLCLGARIVVRFTYCVTSVFDFFIVSVVAHMSFVVFLRRCCLSHYCYPSCCFGGIFHIICKCWYYYLKSCLLPLQFTIIPYVGE